MRLKQVSKRRWKARMMKGLWIPCMVIEDYSLTAPEGYKLVWHPTENFVKKVPVWMKHFTPDYLPDTQKRAWE
jgi:hypothetical protein